VPNPLIFGPSFGPQRSCLGHIKDYTQLVPFFNKFCKSRIDKFCESVLWVFTLGIHGKIKLTWSSEYGILQSALDMYKSNPEVFQEIVILARDKKELRQMMAVR